MKVEPIGRLATMVTTMIDQNTEQQFRSIAIRRIVGKLDRRLIPFLVLLEIASYINRLSIGMHLLSESFVHKNYSCRSC